MAHFRGTVKGQRGEASRLGSAASGLTTTCDGWSLGADCHLFVARDHRINGGDFDRLDIRITSGSAAHGQTFGTLIVRRVGDGIAVVADDQLLEAIRRGWQ